jgi:hypothetical protein
MRGSSGRSTKRRPAKEAGPESSKTPAETFLARRARAAREARDLEILNATADALNREMEDVLADQADI